MGNQCVGSIDGCHIPVMPSSSNHTDYYTERDGTLLSCRQLLIMNIFLGTSVLAGLEAYMMLVYTKILGFTINYLSIKFLIMIQYRFQGLQSLFLSLVTLLTL